MTAWLMVALLTTAGLDIPALHWKPRSDWQSVKPAAIGDGVADDSDALQAALKGLKDGGQLYFPPGTYRLTKTLSLDGPHLGLLLVGCGRDTTLVWDGEPGGIMFRCNGVAHSRFEGLSWDGRGKAAVGFDHDAALRFETEVRHQHEAFRNFSTAGIRIGARPGGQASAELSYLNCLFERCGTGLQILAFNDYDNSLDGCEFRACGYGINDTHGNFYARNCHFEAGAQADAQVGSEHGSSLRWCTSHGSKRFVETSGIAPVTLQDCQVAAWTDPASACELNGAPVLLMDCVFSAAPPADKPAVRAGRRTLVLISGGRLGAPAAGQTADSANGTASPLRLVSGGKRTIEIPAGTLGGVRTSATQTFLRSTVEVSYKVFDAQRDFGAKGDGRTDDTDALQATIDAARAAGGGALAYLPAGNYVIERSLKLTGADYRFGGAGFCTRLLWRGAPQGIGVEVVDPQNVTLENFMIGHHDGGKADLSADIHQTSTGVPSKATYDGVYVFGMYQKKPGQQGLLFDHLGPHCLVIGRHTNGNLRFESCGRAQFLFSQSFEGTVSVSGVEPVRDGLIGFEFRLATIVAPSVDVRDSQSLVMSDFYAEQMERHLVLSGRPGDPPGRVTITGAKIHTSTQLPLVEVNGYRGQLFLGSNQFYCEPKEPRFVTAGDRPFELILAGNFLYQVKPKFELAESATLTIVGNSAVGVPLVDVGADKLGGTAAALNDLRRLGKLDAKVNGW